MDRQVLLLSDVLVIMVVILLFYTMAMLDPHNLLLKSLRYFKIPMDKQQLEIILSLYEQIKLTGNQTRLEDLDGI